MKTIKNLLAIPTALMLCASAFAATWQTQYGAGVNTGNSFFGGSGVPFSVITSVQSNTYYFIAPASTELGQPIIDQVWLKPDLTGCTLDFWVATNTSVLASNLTLGTNIAWLTATNSALATNDVLVIQSASGSDCQMVMISGAAADYAGTIYTNALGQVGIKLFNTCTNVYYAGDKLYKMAKRVSLTPLTLGNATNYVGSPWGNWWALATPSTAMKFIGDSGQPCMISLTVSNTGGLRVTGAYQRRP